MNQNILPFYTFDFQFEILPYKYRILIRIVIMAFRNSFHDL